MNNKKKLILVTGATGLQGGAVAREALEQEFQVRILVRDINSSRVQTLIQSGAEAVEGNFDDQSSLEKAMQNVDAVFSMTLPATPGTDSERQQGFSLIQSAIKSGVKQFIHTSVASTGKHTEFPGWEKNYWSKQYWTDKWEVEEAIRTAGFLSWTILKPAFMMDNFCYSKAKFMFPHLQQGELKTAMFPNTRLDLISADDVASFACAAFNNPKKFNKKNIELASESLTMNEVADILSNVTRRKLTVFSLSPEEGLNQGIRSGLVRSQEWNNEVGYNVDIDSLKNYNINLTLFKDWAKKYKNEIQID
ncbi:NmrA/HSCARG family protein [Priestia endophytica]|uniref:NmrA/HSCARG family protein n=1 Tax=Priestia endophytica TaxID=135735 RepID=UPI002E23BC34|nr:NmrA/HSCARG family protein [Priestia endophytica]